MKRVTINRLSELGSEMRKLRKSKKLGILEAEGVTDVSMATISLMENGKQFPRIYTLVSYAKALGVDEILIKIPRDDEDLK